MPEPLKFEADPFLASFLKESRAIHCLAASADGTVQGRNATMAAALKVTPEGLDDCPLWGLLTEADAASLRRRVHGLGSDQRGKFLLNVVDADHSPFSLECRCEVCPGGFLLLDDPALASVPLVVLSIAGELATKSDRLGDVGYLLKPVGEPELLAAVGRFAVGCKPVVLVVDDEPAVRQMLSVALGRFGFEVHQAGNYDWALDLYWQHRDAIDVVLLDVQMPGLDGPHTLVALQGLDPDVRAVFMSGNTGRYSDDDLLGMGAAHVLAKPFKLADLTRQLWKIATDP